MAKEANNPTHVTTGNVFADLGFSASEAPALRVKAEILSALLQRIKGAGYSRRELETILDEYQPTVSNLLNGKIAGVSIEKLLCYADRLNLQTTIALKPKSESTPPKSSRRHTA